MSKTTPGKLILVEMVLQPEGEVSACSLLCNTSWHFLGVAMPSIGFGWPTSEEKLHGSSETVILSNEFDGLPTYLH
ncbi:hypothetical protein V2J09_013010 [Rumex salicifolius]